MTLFSRILLKYEAYYTVYWLGSVIFVTGIIISILIPLLIGGLAGILTMNSRSIYEGLTLPNLSPPSWIFPIVWTILYVLMGIASYLIYKSDASEKSKKKALTFYAIQLIFNFIWPILFFSLGNYFLSFIWLLILLILIIITIVEFAKISKPAAWLMIPYLLWVTFAGYLNLMIFFLNK